MNLDGTDIAENFTIRLKFLQWEKKKNSQGENEKNIVLLEKK